MLKKILKSTLEQLASRYIKTKNLDVLAVVGSVGKTSTKDAIIETLKPHYPIKYHAKGYNSDLGLPLSVFGLDHPTNLKNIPAWLGVYARIFKQFLGREKAKLLVLEMGIDHPGEMDHYLSVIKPKITVLTSISPEHMDQLIDLDTVAQEELKAIHAADIKIINTDDCDAKYLEGLEYISYGSSAKDYGYNIKSITKDGIKADIGSLKDCNLSIYSENNLKSISSAIAVAMQLGLDIKTLKPTIESIAPFPGRMNVIPGINNSMIIDDSYNSSPLALISAINTLHEIASSRTIAVLGNMNEMGDYAQEAYYTTAKHLNDIDLIYIVGDECWTYYNDYFDEQEWNKDKLTQYKDSVQAGEMLKRIISKDDTVLIKGSQGGVFLEECVKQLVDDQHHSQLVRQSEFWKSRKSF